jgi:hypothetical protein
MIAPLSCLIKSLLLDAKEAQALTTLELLLNKMDSQGLEPWTNRLRVYCSTN